MDPTMVDPNDPELLGNRFNRKFRDPVVNALGAALGLGGSDSDPTSAGGPSPIPSREAMALVSSGRNRADDAEGMQRAQAVAAAARAGQTNLPKQTVATSTPATSPAAGTPPVELASSHGSTTPGTTRFVKMPDGRVVGQRGGASMAVPAGFGSGDSTLRVQGHAPPGPPSGDAFWEQVRTGASTQPLADWGTDFVDVPGGGRSRRLSGIENAVSRREYTDRRMKEEMATEAEQQAAEVRKAQGEQAIETAQIDPLAAARIKAQGQYGGEIIKSQADVASRQAAVQALSQIHAQANKFRAMAANATDPRQGAYFKQQADALEEQAREVGNAILGHAIMQPKNDLLTAILAGLGGSGAAAATQPK